MPVPSINTNFKRSDGTDVSQSFISKDYLLSVYPGIASQLVSPEVWVWGNGASGRLGNNSTTNRLTPVTMFYSGINIWKQISTGYSHAAGIKTDGSLWVWGNNPYSNLGINDNSQRSTPVTTFAGGNDWRQVSCSKFGHNLAIKTDGSLWVWGLNTEGQLGINEAGGQKSTPITTFIGGNDWKQISTGYRHNAAIKNDGSLWTWGFNSYYQLGNTVFLTRSTPITTFAGGNNWKQVSCGSHHVAAIKNDGSLWVWGRNNVGQLGTNDTTSKSIPVTTFAGGNNWKQINAGGFCTAGIKTDGSLWVWGANGNGGLGDYTTISRSTPITTFAGGNNWKQVSCGGFTTSTIGFISAIKTDGTLWTWGYNNAGQLGNNTSGTAFSIPVTIFSGGSNWKLISNGGTYSMAIQSTDIL